MYGIEPGDHQALPEAKGVKEEIPEKHPTPSLEVDWSEPITIRAVATSKRYPNLVMRLPAEVMVEVKETSGSFSTWACPMVGTGKAPSNEPRFVIVAPTDHKKAWKLGSAKAHGLEPCFAFHASFLPHHKLSRGCATVKIKPTESEEAVPHSMEVLESELLSHWRDDPALAWAALVGTVGMSRFAKIRDLSADNLGRRRIEGRDLRQVVMLDQGSWSFYDATEEPFFPGQQALAGLWKILQRLLPLGPLQEIQSLAASNSRDLHSLMERTFNLAYEVLDGRAYSELVVNSIEQGAIGILPTGKPSFAMPMSNMAEFQMPVLWKTRQLAIALTGKADSE